MISYLKIRYNDHYLKEKEFYNVIQFCCSQKFFSCFLFFSYCPCDESNLKKLMNTIKDYFFLLAGRELVNFKALSLLSTVKVYK
jgi:hypothetical protein